MKTSTKKSLCICMILIIVYANAQSQTDWQLTGNAVGSTDFIGTTNSNSFKIFTNGGEVARFLTTGELGIGVTSPVAWLQVKSTGTKETFRTDVPDTYDNFWRMYRNGTEYGRFVNFDGGNAFNIQAARGHLRFATGVGGSGGTAVAAMEIREQGGADAGYVTIGTYGGSFSPSCRLHLHEVTASTPIAFQISNNSTGYSTTDGFRILNDNSGRVTMYNWEDDDIAFGTGNSSGGLAERMIISSGINYGRVGIGTGPGAQLDVYDATDLSISGDDIGFQVDERLQDANVVNRGIGAEFYTKNGYQTIGMSNTVDNYNTTYSSGLKLQGMYITIRDFTGASGTDFSDGVVIDSYDADNFAENKSGITAAVGNATSTVTNTLNTYGANLIAQSYNGNNFGGKFEAIRPSGGTGSSYGVWAKAPQQTCTTTAGITTCAGAAGYFDGDVFATKTVYQSSDLALKDNITPLTNASTILDQLTPKQYTFNKQIHPNLNLPSGQHYGFISQEVETFLPGIVKDFQNPAVYDSAGNETFASFSIKALNYIEIIPILVSAFKEQKAIIDSLVLVIQNPTPLPNINPQNSQKISLSNVSSIILNQNDPNPFTESTRITFQIPDEVKDARIIFTSTTGSIINTAIINERGAGELEVYSSELSKGLYNYTLVCDGKVIATKKMVKQ